MSEKEVPIVEIQVETISGEMKPLRFKTITMLESGIVRKYRHDVAEQMFQTFEWACDAEALAFLDKEVAGWKMMEVLQQMQKASEVELGKSSASSTSSKSTARRSKQSASTADSA